MMKIFFQEEGLWIYLLFLRKLLEFLKRKIYSYYRVIFIKYLIIVYSTQVAKFICISTQENKYKTKNILRETEE